MRDWPNLLHIYDPLLLVGEKKILVCQYTSIALTAHCNTAPKHIKIFIHPVSHINCWVEPANCLIDQSMTLLKTIFRGLLHNAYIGKSRKTTYSLCALAPLTYMYLL